MEKTKLVGIFFLFLSLVGCTNPNSEDSSNNNRMNQSSEIENNHMMNSPTQNENNHMNANNIGPLDASKGLNEIKIPEVLEKQENSEVDYEITASIGATEFFEDTQTETYGYNGHLLGPTVRLKEGETIKVKFTNDLNEPTTVHWHGLEIPGEVDGGPNQLILPGEDRIITLKANQPSATLWYHPHPHGDTGKQVFKGLGGLLYIDEQEDITYSYPDNYGINDIPLIFQDRQFDENVQWNYEELMDTDGTLGNIGLINGTMDPKLTVTEPVMRFRLLNASNAREYTFQLNNGDSFKQIATDGGKLKQPVEMQEIILSPSERVEVLIDFSEIDPQETVAIIDEFGNTLLPMELAFDPQQKETISEFTTDKPFLSEEEKNLPITKEVELFGQMNMVTINGRKFDPNRIDLRQEQGVTEVWEIYNRPDMMGGTTHPFHIHGTQFKIISRDDAEVGANEQGLKDSVLVESGERVKLLVTFPEKGIFPFHCHILEHEDNGMMGLTEVY